MSNVPPLPGHLSQRFQEVYELPVGERTRDPGFTSANEAPAIGDKAVHRVADTRMKVSAAINAIVLREASHVMDHVDREDITYI